ncbi:hypothetical protein K458DRAFT_43371 [Lentithecium fluviatile CBS 122367]|uniref:Uncharacterized protein n=1 Tax=Lentithecium fluviatile CBS 122367 TaxID=1168545 RepID=A0A6G1J032_9PLEO|nr:hypothetical protein K458DRAFT_43371 [Lentithecium fluviatile CBS 122367]
MPLAANTCTRPFIPGPNAPHSISSLVSTKIADPNPNPPTGQATTAQHSTARHGRSLHSKQTSI